MTVGWLVLGALVGGLHGWTQWWTVARLRPAAVGLGLVSVLAGALLRWLLAAGLLLMAVLEGLAAGLLALAGMTAVRWALVLWWNRNAWGPAGPKGEG
jgi:hypothetical protein